MSVGIDSREIALVVGVVGSIVALVVGALVWVGIAAFTGLLMIGFATLLFSATFIARHLTKERSEAWFVLVNTVLLGSIVTAAWLLLGVRLPVTWLAFALGLILAVQGTALLFTLYRRRFMHRVFKPNVPAWVFERKEHSWPYLALPMGCFTGAIVSAVLKYDGPTTVRSCILLTMGLLVLGTFLTVVWDAMLIAKPHVVANAWSQHLEVGTEDGLVVRVPNLDPNRPQTQEQMLDGISIASDFRDLLLLNQYAVLAVFVACAIGLSAMVAYGVGLGAWVLLVLGLGVLLVQLPYLIGQMRAHDVALSGLLGTRRQELRERLQKLAPPIPVMHSCIGFLASGGAGSVLGKLLEKTLEGLVTGKP